MKGTTRIVGAFVLGVVVITAAFFLRGSRETTASGDLAIVAQSPGEKPQARDTNQNGIEDWREELEQNVLEEITIGTSTFGLNEPYEEPKTFTDKFARSFFQSFMEGKMMGKNPEDQAALIEEAIKTIENSTSQRLFSKGELSVVDTSLESIHTYANDVANILLKESAGNMDETAILQEALETGDPEKIKELAPIRKAYEETVLALSEISVPGDFTEVHLAILSSFEGIRTDIEAMEQAFTDPLLTLARVKRYENDLQGLYASLRLLYQQLYDTDVEFQADDPALYFLIFRE